MGKSTAKLGPMEKKIQLGYLFGGRQGWRKEGLKCFGEKYDHKKRKGSGRGSQLYVSNWLVSTLV